jgi:hypothetical protein
MAFSIAKLGPYIVYTSIYTTLKFLALQGAPYTCIYDISRLRVNTKVNTSTCTYTDLSFTSADWASGDGELKFTIATKKKTFLYELSKVLKINIYLYEPLSDNSMSASEDRQQYNRNKRDRTEFVKKHKCFYLLSNVIKVRNTKKLVVYAALVEGIRNVYNILARGILKRSLGKTCPIDIIIIFKQINK